MLSISFLSFINGSERTNSPAGLDTSDCDPNIIYFKQDVLPLLQSNCAKSGCHNEESQKHGVILTSYENLIRTVEIEDEDDDDDRFDDRDDDDRGRNKNRDNDRLKNFLQANGSQGDRYKNKLEKMLRRNKMPPAPNKKLTQEQKDIIYKWIDQGMQNNSCEISASDCMSENMSFESDIRPIIDENCVGCHSGAKPKMGYDFSNSEKFREVALTGDVYLAITHSEGVTAMPFEGDKLSDCDIKKIKSWIDDGAVLK
ncbi:MAG: c-type cytochrome [Ignavibacteria bacterium]|nr:c-type cytochrome [Ignavibacteria bacterium]